MSGHEKDMWIWFIVCLVIGIVLIAMGGNVPGGLVLIIGCGLSGLELYEINDFNKKNR